MQTTVEKSDYDFLLKVDMFCRNIDPYVDLLTLSASAVEELKNNIRTFEYILLAEGPLLANTGSGKFVRSRLNNMKLAYSNLVQACKNSKNYTAPMGSYLGLEISYYETRLALAS